MSREVKRVALNFDWPLNERWEGYLWPDSLQGDPCPDCFGGQTHAGWWLQHLCNRIDMLAQDVGDQKQGRPMHPWLKEDAYPHGQWEGLQGGPRNFKVVRPSADIVTLVARLEGESEERIMNPMRGFSNGIYKAVTKAAGLENFGHCETCDGKGSLEKYPGQRADGDAWERTEPPDGEGWQLWESVSEGSPISPVFESAEALAAWMASPAYTRNITGAPLTYKGALAFVHEGWVPSMMEKGGVLYTNEATV